MFTRVINVILKFAVVVVFLVAVVQGIDVGGMAGFLTFGFYLLIGILLLSAVGLFVEMAVNIQEIKEYITSGNYPIQYVQGPGGTVSNSSVNLSKAASDNNVR